jgi:hypothetical protein
MASFEPLPINEQEGVLFVTCQGCQNRHLIADSLRWFNKAATNSKTILAPKGEEVRKLSADGRFSIEAFLGCTALVSNPLA